MREPNKNYVYDLSELTSEERGIIENYLNINTYNFKYLYFYNRWRVYSEGSEFNKETANAKELFYTLENIQVDCRNLSEEQVNNMCNIYKSKGYVLSNIYNRITEYHCYISLDPCVNYFGYYDDDYENYHTITYEKFMELFGRKEENFKKIVEVLNEELTEKANLEFNPVSEHKLFQAYKETANKLNYELDFNFITQLAERMAQNKYKYEPYNWQKLDNIDELKQALFRHVLEVMKGNYEDDNRLLGHLESIALNCMFINYQLNKNMLKNPIN